MKLSVLCTINSRPTPVLDAVFGSLREQPFDELIIVLDRSPQEVVGRCHDYWGGDGRVGFVLLDGKPGWQSPVPAWNAAFGAMTGDALFAFSSEVVHAPQNVAVARRLMDENPNDYIFGKASCSCGPGGGEVNWGSTAPSNLLVDAAHPRPLGFIWAGPTAPVKQIGGMDAKFSDGLWYDDDDFFYRLWRLGHDFIFTDEISGVHLHHERPVLATVAGQKMIARNQAYMMSKYRMLRPLDIVIKQEIRQPGLTLWRHM